MVRLKQIPRDDVDAIRPYQREEIKSTEKPPTIEAFVKAGVLREDNDKTPSSSPLPKDKDTTQSEQNDLDAQVGPMNTRGEGGGEKKKNFLSPFFFFFKVRKKKKMIKKIRLSWTRGAVVEVYSRGKKRWMRGMVGRVFVDDEGEWLEIRYGTNLVKEIPRYSTDIRPLRPRFKNDYIFTV
ncbi:hypothetical protein RFI_13558 [Reticulomyxa filosa]|uniref:Uncharacterized protein n=1 Tax=Reticulomyxa filosa TaxID=46433 RepID=X6NBF2_RETFI|nr:hypothetical protein RFI_13558 [Reticulomyxa filosa]|eukprot:ETO23620.1 hypothetical protein RFI_13558 [Reticulomyxa filosa]